MPKITARISPVVDGRGLFLLIDSPITQDSTDTPDQFDLLRDDYLNTAGDVAFPILPEEIEAIRDACQKWLDAQESQVDQIADRVLEAND